MNPSIKPVDAFGRMGEENAFAVLARAAALSSQGNDIINLGIGQPDFPTPENITNAAIKAIRDGHHGYTAAQGMESLREAVAHDLATRHCTDVDSANVMIVPGGKVTMFAAIMMLGEPGAQILYPDPGFPIYRSMIEFTGAQAVPIPIREENHFAFSADETLSLITPATRLIIINSPANPCGGVTPRAEFDALVKGLEEFPHIAILSDEIYDQMTYDNQEHVSLLSYPEIRNRLILLNGWSKTYAMTGWRLGYSLWPDSLFDAVRKLAVNSWSCVNAPAQYAALEALTGPQDSVSGMMNAFDQRRRKIVEALNNVAGVSCIRPTGAFYAFANISQTGWQSKALANALLEQAGVATIGGPDFGVHGEGFIRLSYANSLSNIEQAIERIAEFLANEESSPTRI